MERGGGKEWEEGEEGVGRREGMETEAKCSLVVRNVGEEDLGGGHTGYHKHCVQRL